MSPVLLPSAETLDKAVTALGAGDLIGLPTETVYGLAGDATNDLAIAQIYSTKGRPCINPLIIHCVDAAVATQYGMFNDAARTLASVFWPGPLTLIVRRTDEQTSRRVETENAPQLLSSSAHISLLALAGLDTIALRVPAHPVAQNVLRAFGKPLAAPSANPSGRLSPTMPQHVAQGFAGTAQPKLIIAGGRADIGLESTIVDVTGDKPILLRPGAITAEEISQALGMPIATADGDPDKPNAPGQLLKHYAPRTPLRLNADSVNADEILIAFGPVPFFGKTARAAFNLSETGDLNEAAAHLFAHLHAADTLGAPAIAVMPIPSHGLGIAINERLHRAAY